MDRAYSVLSIKSVDEDQRVITGVATSPSPDRLGDVVEPMGVSFKNPLPLLWQHKSAEPVGSVKFDKPTEDGITFTAKLPNVTEPGRLKDRIDEAWQSVKLGLVKAVSIGFRAIEYSFMDDGGIRFMKTEVMELSLVTIPANADAMIDTIRNFDGDIRAASGRKDIDVFTSRRHGETSRTSTAQKGARTVKTLADQIAALEAKRAANAQAMNAIVAKAIEENRSKDEQERQEFETLDTEIKTIDSELVDLRRLQEVMKSQAVPIIPDRVNSPEAIAAHQRHAPVVQMRSNLPPGITFARYVMALASSRGNIMQAYEIAKSNQVWMSQSPELATILKAAVAAGTTTDTTWAAPLVEYQIMSEEFINWLRPRTIIGRIPGLRRVPFKVKVPRQTAAASVNWVGEGKVKPVSSLAFDSVTLDFTKIAGIIALTDELVRFSNPSAEALVREDLAAGIIQLMDSDFVDPSKADQAPTSPASITNGVTPTPASGTTASALRTDIKALMQAFLTANMSPESAVWIMTQGQALAISLMVNSLGQPEFPGVTVNGGTFVGLPVVASENIPATGSSPTDGYPIILAQANEIMLADDGQVTIDASREASLQMDTAPDSPETTSTIMISLWQHNMVGIKAERFINWKKRRTTAVQYISFAKYAE